MFLSRNLSVRKSHQVLAQATMSQGNVRLLSMDIGVRAISNHQESRICMAQIVNDELCLIRERIGCDSEKRFNSPPYSKRYCDKERRVMIGIA
jgi:hypothetical protein